MPAALPSLLAAMIWPTDFRFWQIVLQKSFGGGERNFLRPLMRFVPRDVRDLIAHQKNATELRIGATEYCSGGVAQNSAFARFSVLSNFRLLQQYRHETDMAGLAGDFCFPGYFRSLVSGSSGPVLPISDNEGLSMGERVQVPKISWLWRLRSR